MRLLLACTCLTPVALLAVAGTAQAERVINSAITTPVRTSTATDGSPDDIRITDAGSIKPTGGAAVTIDSNNNVKNEGAIEIENANDATGILALPGRSGNITHSGTIRIVEDYEPKDVDDDKDLDGPFAQGARRYGIRIAPGGTFTGNVASTGSITIEGNDSAGIALDSRLNGNLTSSGAISVVGDRSFGIRAGDVSGNVTVNGPVSARGEGSVGVALDGNIGGALVIQSTITSIGYRYTTPPGKIEDLDDDDLLQGGSAIRIAGNVAGGIIFAVPPPDNDKDDDDEDDDGIDDDKEGRANVLVYGSAPAVQIGAASTTVTVGAVAGNEDGHGLVIDGTIAGHGLYEGIAGNGLAIGGLGGDVLIAGGMTVNGVVGASANDASATGLRVGAGATVDEIVVNGRVSAEAGSGAGVRGTAILIEQGANVSTVRNSGEIRAGAGQNAVAGAIVDLSGGLGLIENAGEIRAAASGDSSTAVAIDLRANGAGAVVRQIAVGEGSRAPRITGEILFGGGDDRLEVADGTVIGTTRFGAGADELALSGDASYTGTVDFGTGEGRMTMGGTSAFSGTANFREQAASLVVGGDAHFAGRIVGGTGLAVQVNGGTFAVTDLERVDLSTLSAGDGSTIGISVDAAAGRSTRLEVAGVAAFSGEVDVQVRLSNVSESEGRYVFLSAGAIEGADSLGFDASTLPIMFRGSVEAGDAANELAVVIARKSAQDLNLNGSASRAYDAIFQAIDTDEAIGGVFLAMRDEAVFRSQVAQMLPDHAGGVFETVTLGSRATARFLADPRPPLASLGGGWGFWLQQVGWGTSKDLGDTAAYDITGWGASGGIERRLGTVGSLGGSIAYLAGRDADGENDNEVRTEQFELAAYWRGQWGGLRAYARASAARIDFDGKRYFTGVDADGDTVRRTNEASWNGELYSAAAGLSYERRFGRLVLRPAASLDYYRLSEDGYAETGGGEGFDLIVDSRSSDELAATVTLTAGLDFGRRDGQGTWFRTEIEAGRRQIVAGELGATVARFGDGEAFTLLPEDRTNGWVGSLRAMGGNGWTMIGAEALAEEQNGRASVAFRVSLGLGF